MFRPNEVLSEEKVNNMNPVVLAFIGDAVYSLYVRTKLSVNSDSKSGELNKRASALERAASQAKLIEELMPFLTEKEQAIFRRARNAKKATKSKSATVFEYNMSTGFEAVIGYLYLTGNSDRIDYLLELKQKDED